MIIYFTASIVGKKYYLVNYLQIIKILKEKGYEVISDHIIKTSEKDIKLEKREDRLAFQEKLEKWIHSCDFMIVEASFPSISVGYEISLALHRNKPVLLLYSNGNAPSLLVDSNDEKLVCEEYSPESLNSIIEDFINYVQGANDSRFTFFITSEMASHLKKMAKKERVPKAVYLRRLIQKDLPAGK